MITVYAIHAPSEVRLQAIISEMRELGRPTVRVVDCGDHYMALEGSHRIAAAAALELVPEFIVYEQSDMLKITEFDWYDAENWSEQEYSAGEVAGELFSPSQALDYRFDQ